jgi:hypothetical protein
MATTTKIVRKRIKVEEVTGYECDRCKKFIALNDWIEAQEMLRWRMTGGYGSVFGDGARISLDLCQNCTEEILGAFIQINDEE